MARRSRFVAAFAFLTLFATGAAWAQSCQNGNSIYHRKLGSGPGAVEISCSQSSCHGNDPKNDMNGISTNGQTANGISNALDTVADMSGLRSGLSLSDSDLNDIALYIWYRSFNQACPAAGAANVSAAPGSLSFGSVGIGSASAAQTVTVSNTGSASSTSITYPGAAPAGFTRTGGTCATGPLAAGASCTLVFTFNPTVAGPANGTYTTSGGASLNIALSGTGTSVIVTAPNVNAAPTALSFGSVNVGSTSATQTVTVTNSGTGAVTDMTYPPAPAGYNRSGTCASPTIAAGASCTLVFSFTPTFIGSNNPTYLFSGGTKSIGIAFTGAGAAAGGPATLSATPATLGFGNVTAGTTSSAQTITVRNTGGVAASGIALANSNPAEFVVSANSCGASLAAGATCTLSVAYKPASPGSDGATITFTYASGSPVVVTLSGVGTDGTVPPAPTTATAQEFYHAAFDHYFITSIPDEITKLSNGTFAGWAATGKQFKVYTSTGTGLAIVCRFFSTAFDPKSSHFYTGLASECLTVKANPSWQFEGEVFHVGTPDASGACAAGTVPVYRLYNNGLGAAPNHRFTTDLAVRTEMIAKGWTPEGYGIGVTMCAPQ